MCTAMTYRTTDFYFGRTLDYEWTYGETVTVTPRRFPLPFRSGGMLERHYALIGMAHVAEGYPLYYDAVNEMGLAMAGLNFVGNACYQRSMPGWENVAQFELIPWLLAQCATVREAKQRLETLRLTDVPFSPQLPPAELHWLLADREEAVVIEPLRDGLRVMDNPVGVLTNNPPFAQQLFRLNDYLGLSADPPSNRFSPQLPLQAYSRGMGALGLPGDLSSQSRFARAAFVRNHGVSGTGELESVSQMFHMLGSVEQPRGCCRLEDGSCEITQYTACCNADRGIYYYTTYDNHQITAVRLHREDLDGAALVCYPLLLGEQIHRQN